MIGNRIEPKTNIGALSSEEAVVKIINQSLRAVAEGVKILLVGKKWSERSFMWTIALSKLCCVIILFIKNIFLIPL